MQPDTIPNLQTDHNSQITGFTAWNLQIVGLAFHRLPAWRLPSPSINSLINIINSFDVILADFE